MSNIIELSTGHVFASGSVKAVGPLVPTGIKQFTFDVVGVGFVASVFVDASALPDPDIPPSAHMTREEREESVAAWRASRRGRLVAVGEAVRQEAISKLLGGAS